MRIYISIYLATGFFFSNVAASLGQTVAGLPMQFVQFYKTYMLVNPASICREATAEFNTGNRALTGGFSDVRTFYANANVQLNKFVEGQTKHVVGLTFINEKEGTYINKNTASFLYAIHIPLSQRLTFSAGAAAGFINYAFKASNVNAGGSAFAPNGDVGLWLYRTDFNLGISCNQIIPSRLTPFNTTYLIDRHYNFIADKSFAIDRNFKLTPTMVFRLFNKDLYDLDVGLVGLIQNNLTAAIAYKYRKGTSVSAGFSNIKIGQSIFKLLFSYYDAVGSLNYYNPQSYELSLNIMPARKQQIAEEY